MTRTLPEVAVLGAGRMGAAIVFVFGRSGHTVRLFEPDDSARRRAGERLGRLAESLGSPSTGDLPISDDLAGTVDGAGFIIEAASEDPATKRGLFARLGECASPDAIVATNTSSIPIEQFTAGFPRGERLLYAHFWNPPYAIRLVEVAPGPDTSAPTTAAAATWLSGAGMAPVTLRRAVPGLIGNRLQHALKREAIALVADGVCDAETIDDVAKLGFGARMAVLGPLEQSDLVGLDLTLAIHDQLIPTLDVTPGPHPYLADKVARGELGMDAGAGFREWTPATAKAVRDRLDDWTADTSRAHAATPGTRTPNTGHDRPEARSTP